MFDKSKNEINENIVPGKKEGTSASGLKATLLTVLDEARDAIAEAEFGVLGAITISQELSVLNTFPDGVYEAQTFGVYKNGLTAKEGYYTRFRKTANNWSLESETKMPIPDMTEVNEAIDKMNDFIKNFKIDVDEEFDSESENPLSNKKLTAVIGEYKTPPINDDKIIGITTIGDNISQLSSKSAYFLTNYTFDKNGVVTIISIYIHSIAIGTDITIGQFSKSNSNYTLKNETTFKTTLQNGWQKISVDWDYTAGDFIGFKPNIANLSKFFTSGKQGIIPIDSNYQLVESSLQSSGLSLNFNINFTNEATQTISERLEKVEKKAGSLYFKERPESGIVNFQVEINTNIANVTDVTLNNQDSKSVLNDWGILLLPTNYNEKDKPIRMLINCHGTGTYLNGSSTGANITASSFWLSQGFAVMDMNCLPDGLIGTGTDANVRHYGSPYALQSMIKGYKYVIENYNIKPEVFLTGISMGGLISFQIALSNTIPIIAQGAFCPCIDIYKQAYSRPWNGANQRKYMSQLFGFTGTAPIFTTNVPPSQAEIDYFKLNYDKIVGYDNMMKGLIGATYAEMHSINGANVTSIANSTEDALYNSKQKTHPIPLKIWHNTNDTTVLYRYSKYYVDMVRNLGGLAYLRTFPSGGHNAWLNGTVVTGIPTIDGVTTSIETSMYECLLWFKRFD